jgi:hypothetical protein
MEVMKFITKKRMSSALSYFLIIFSCLVGSHIGSTIHDQDPKEADELDSGVCVTSKQFKGIIVSRIIKQQKDGREWCFVYTKDKTEQIWVDELTSIPCSQILKDFPLERKIALADWIDGQGENPMLVDSIK